MRKYFILATACALLAASHAGGAEVDWKKVDAAIGKTDTQTGKLHRYGLPRTDASEIKTGLALGGWVAFEDMGSSAMMMGGSVLTESEINPVMTKLLDQAMRNLPKASLPDQPVFLCSAATLDLNSAECGLTSLTSEPTII